MTNLFAAWCSKASAFDVNEDDTNGFAVTFQVGPFVFDFTLTKRSKRQWR